MISLNTLLIIDKFDWVNPLSADHCDVNKNQLTTKITVSYNDESVGQNWYPW